MDQANRFAAIDLYIPSTIHTHIDALVSRNDRDTLPFRRQIDLWWTGLVIGLRLSERQDIETGAMSKFGTGVILNSDPWRIVHLEMIGLTLNGSHALASPNKIVAQAQEHANGGMSWLLNELLGKGEPTLSLTNLIGELH